MMRKNRFVSLFRAILSATFLFSGFVKAVDPHGTEYKIEEYVRALGLGDAVAEWMPLAASMLLATAEFAIGACMISSVCRRLAAWAALAFMAVMTPVTLWLAIDDPVSDCGCFGDAIVLSNWQTFAKNVALLACAVFLFANTKYNLRSNKLHALRYSACLVSVAAVCFVEWWGLYHLPVIDFRPYKIGADIREGMMIPDGAERDEYETTFVFEKEGRQETFTLDNYPDSTWKYISTDVKLIRKGYAAPIHDFVITNAESHENVTDMVLDAEHVFLVLALDIAKADREYKDKINSLYARSRSENCGFYFITASTDKAIEEWKDDTDAAYQFYQMDGTTIKTIIRSNPGIVELRKGVVAGKWNVRDYYL